MSQFNPNNSVPNFFLASAEDFKKIPGSPIAYWTSQKAIKIYETTPLIANTALPKQGSTIGDNERFLRMWYEIALPFNKKWKNAVKGGVFRRWYGNLLYVVDWGNDGQKIKSTGKATIRNSDCLFKSGIEWSRISSSNPSFRILKDKFFHESASGVAFPLKQDRLPVLCMLNTKISKYFLNILNPTLTFQSGDISKIPYLKIDCRRQFLSLIKFSKLDWDSYEISWDFNLPPIFIPDFFQSSLKVSYEKLRANWQSMTLEMQGLEEENNRIFIEAYGLQDELTPDVPLSEITLTCNPHYRYGGNKNKEELEALLRTDTIKELISYAVGCMMGRYSLDKPGLVYAHSGNIGFDPSAYQTFPADNDGIIPVMDEEWFPDDATNRFIKFIKTAWPPEYLDENLQFIADSLGPKTNEMPVDTIRRYISTGFFKDHLKTYKKRPIYWLFSSGKLRAFECLIYLHRYNESTLSRMRSSYVTPLQGNFSARLEYLQNEQDAVAAASAKRKIQKEIDQLKKKMAELKTFDDNLRHYADMRISLDLDDGVKVNYGKFGDLLAETKAITGN